MNQMMYKETSVNKVLYKTTNFNFKNIKFIFKNVKNKEGRVDVCRVAVRRLGQYKLVNSQFVIPIHGGWRC